MNMNTKPSPDNSLKKQLMASIAVTVTGLLLLAFMIIAEDEPGAIPLAMIVSGSAWHIVSRIRHRRSIKEA